MSAVVVGGTTTTPPTTKGRKPVKAEKYSANELRTGLDGLLSAGANLMTRDDVTPMVAARTLMESHRLDHDTLERLAFDGLVARLSGIEQERRYLAPKSKDRDPAAEFMGRYQLRTRHGRRELDDILRRVRYEVGGVYKSLADFTLADIQTVRDLAQSHIAGWKKKDRALADFEAELARNKASAVSDLPPASIEKLRKAAQKAW